LLTPLSSGEYRSTSSLAANSDVKVAPVLRLATAMPSADGKAARRSQGDRVVTAAQPSAAAAMDVSLVPINSPLHDYAADHHYHNTTRQSSASPQALAYQHVVQRRVRDKRASLALSEDGVNGDGVLTRQAAASAAFAGANDARGKPMLLISTPAPTAGEAVLARPIPPGLQIAAAIASFSELAERRIWAPASTNDISFLSHDDVDALYDARCRDQHSSSNAERRCRFHALMSEACKGSWYVLRQAGLGPESVGSIAKMLAENERITHLDLSGNNVGPVGARALAALMQTNDTICVLRLQSANLGEGSRLLAHALRQNSTLTALDLSGISGVHRNCVWGPAVTAMAELLSNTRVLAYVNFGTCGLQKGTADIVAGAARAASLTYLGLAGNHAGDESCKALQQFLSEGHSDLTTLDLQQNAIGPRGLRCIGAGLRSGGKPANALTSLDLSDNAITGVGLADFAESWCDASALTAVTLDRNHLCAMGLDQDGFRLPDSPSGVMAIFRVLASDRCHVTKVVLSHCSIRSVPETTLTASLGSPHCKVTYLDVSENPFGDAGLLTLGRAVAENHTLVTLKCTRCEASTAGLETLAAALRIHPALEHVFLMQGGNIDYDVHVVPAAVVAPALLSIDVPKLQQPTVAPRLEANKAAKLRKAGPQLVETRRATYLQQRSIDQTRELITAEVKARDRLTEVSRHRRERQKALMASFKSELAEVTEVFQRQQHDVSTRELELRAQEETIDDKRRAMEATLARLKMGLERQQQLRHEACTACVKMLSSHYALHPPSTVVPPVFVKVAINKTADGASTRHCSLMSLAAQQNLLQSQLNASAGGGLGSSRLGISFVDDSTGMTSPQMRRRSSLAPPGTSGSPTPSLGASFSATVTAAAAAVSVSTLPTSFVDPVIVRLEKELADLLEGVDFERRRCEEADAKTAQLQAVVDNGGRPLPTAGASRRGSVSRSPSRPSSAMTPAGRVKAASKAASFVASAQAKQKKGKPVVPAKGKKA
jgi:Ran GTPase-activating protein (RanGAP) involved in mRNA processing and transport